MRKDNLTNAQNQVAELEFDLLYAKRLPTKEDFEAFLSSIKDEDWYDSDGRDANSMAAKKSFLFSCQLILILLLGREAYVDFQNGRYACPPEDLWIVICRLLCAVFMHITLSGELRQSFAMMKYALNHSWKFTSWAQAYRVGL